jgi:hypothetical protein
MSLPCTCPSPAACGKLHVYQASTPCGSRSHSGPEGPCTCRSHSGPEGPCGSRSHSGPEGPCTCRSSTGCRCRKSQIYQVENTFFTGKTRQISNHTVGLWFALCGLGLLGLYNAYRPTKLLGLVILILSILSMYFPIRIAGLTRRLSL